MDKLLVVGMIVKPPYGGYEVVTGLYDGFVRVKEVVGGNVFYADYGTAFYKRTIRKCTIIYPFNEYKKLLK